MFKGFFRKKKRTENPEIKRLIELSRRIEIYSGTLEELEDMKSAQYEVLDNGLRDKRVRVYPHEYCTHDAALQELRLMEKIGAEALIRYEDRRMSGHSIVGNILYYGDPWRGQGIPVRRKK